MTRKPSASVVGSTTGTPPPSVMHSGYEVQYGAGSSTSSPGSHEHLEGVVDGVLPAVGDDDLRGGAVDAGVALGLERDRLPQLGQARRRRVVVEAGLPARGDRGLDDRPRASGSRARPAPKPMTFSPAAFRALALASTASVADSLMAAMRAEMRPTGPILAAAAIARPGADFRPVAGRPVPDSGGSARLALPPYARRRSPGSTRVDPAHGALLAVAVAGRGPGRHARRARARADTTGTPSPEAVILVDAGTRRGHHRRQHARGAAAREHRQDHDRARRGRAAATRRDDPGERATPPTVETMRIGMQAGQAAGRSTRRWPR